MTNESTSPAIVTVTPELAKAKIRNSLTTAQLGIQAVLDKANALVFNEDNLPQIKEALTEIGKVLKAIDKAHETGKAPAWAECKAWDAAKNDLRGLLAPTEVLVTNKHTKLCQAVEKRKREADAETARKKGIEELLSNTILGFSQEITACKTSAELVSIQARINAEQGKKSAYQEYLPILIERCAELNQPLKDQKKAILELEGLNAAEEVALKEGDDEKLLEIQEKKEQIGEIVQENRIKTEESAINSSTRGYGGGFTQTFPTVKPARRTWKYEVKDIEALYKKCPGLVTLTPNDEKIKEILKEKIAEGETKDKESIDFMGLILFYVDKKW